ncbi:MAG: phospholipase D family protein [Burkholderiales bacterium]
MARVDPVLSSSVSQFPSDRLVTRVSPRKVRRLVVASCLLAMTAAFMSGCATVPRDVERKPSVAFQDHESTRLGSRIAKDAAQHPGQSGFSIMRYGHPAFTTRIVLADLAQKSIDVQYYIWEADATANILADRLARAAERGVRVRVLVDDANLGDRDSAVASFAAHPNIEVRLFNPFAQRSAKEIGFLTDFERVNHRMHNKLMVVDNAVAIVGGRNMSDPYFGVNPEHNFRDLDVVAVGPIVRELSKVYDRFWNGEWAVPITAVVDRPRDMSDFSRTMKAVREWIPTSSYPWPLEYDVASMEREMEANYQAFVWAPAQVLWDDPASINDPALRTMSKALGQRFREVQSEVLVESAYFVPREPGVALAEQLRARGVRMRLLTNSLASNDVLAAFAGYSKYRKQFVAANVELYELRPDAGPIRKRMFFGVAGGGRAGLHTKAIVFDRKAVFIGSFNLDSRSSFINTEAGLYIESPALAAQLAAHMDEGVQPENAYRVRLDTSGQLYWVTEDEGQEVRYDVDPLSTPMQRLEAGWIRMLPILDQL